MYGYYDRKNSYRTKTYIAGDWTGDKDAIDVLYSWKENRHLTLDWVDAHDLTQARDTSLNCSIKASLKTRLDVSKTFVLVVGNETKNLRSGSCSYCDSYSAYFSRCNRGHSLDFRSYIDYECDKAVEAGIKIVVLYNSSIVDKEKCPFILRSRGQHVAMKKYNFVYKRYEWDYQAVKNAIE